MSIMSDSNKRQDPFARLRTNPQEPIDLIPRAKAKTKKSRTWEKQNPLFLITFQNLYMLKRKMCVRTF